MGIHCSFAEAKSIARAQKSGFCRAHAIDSGYNLLDLRNNSASDRLPFFFLVYCTRVRQSFFCVVSLVRSLPAAGATHTHTQIAMSVLRKRKKKNSREKRRRNHLWLLFISIYHIFNPMDKPIGYSTTHLRIHFFPYSIDNGRVSCEFNGHGSYITFYLIMIHWRWTNDNSDVVDGDKWPGTFVPHIYRSAAT